MKASLTWILGDNPVLTRNKLFLWEIGIARSCELRVINQTSPNISEKQHRWCWITGGPDIPG